MISLESSLAFLGAPDPYAVEDEDIVMVDRDDIDAPKEGSRGSRHSDRRSRRKVSEDSSDIRPHTDQERLRKLLAAAQEVSREYIRDLLRDS
jgi:hypothetical protein